MQVHNSFRELDGNINSLFEHLAHLSSPEPFYGVIIHIAEVTIISPQIS